MPARLGAYEKDRALGGIALAVCPLINLVFLVGLYVVALALRAQREPIDGPAPAPTPLNQLSDLIFSHFSLFAILPWLGALAIALFCGLRRRKPKPPAIAHGLVGQVGPAPGDNAAWGGAFCALAPGVLSLAHL